MTRPDWFEKLQPFGNPDNLKAFLYILTSLIPYLIIVTFMFFFLHWGFPYWTVLLLCIPAVGFYIRTFIVLHDCAHTSFVNSKILSYFLGHLCGIVTLTPFFDWQRNHGLHHANVSNLDKRGIGDVWTMTLKEYQESGFWKKMLYRLFRNPFFLFTLAPIFLFGVMYRFPQKSTRRKDYFSIILTDVILAMIVFIAYHTVGIKNYLMVFLPIIFISTTFGLWLFYIQHQFENVYWAHQANWDLISAALKGSSFYKLPLVLRWFTGNIGFHNIHHLKPRIACYHLKKCYDQVPELHYGVPITLKSSLKSLKLRLWDEKSLKLISFKEANK